jgi:hypothetical protein
MPPEAMNWMYGPSSSSERIRDRNRPNRARNGGSRILVKNGTPDVAKWEPSSNTAANSMPWHPSGVNANEMNFSIHHVTTDAPEPYGSRGAGILSNDYIYHIAERKPSTNSSANGVEQPSTRYHAGV